MYAVVPRTTDPYFDSVADVKDGCLQLNGPQAACGPHDNAVDIQTARRSIPILCDADVMHLSSLPATLHMC